MTAIAFPVGPIGLVLQPRHEARVRFSVRGLYQRTLFEEATCRDILAACNDLQALARRQERLLWVIEARIDEATTATAYLRIIDLFREIRRTRREMRDLRTTVFALAADLGLPVQSTGEIERAARAYLADPALAAPSRAADPVSPGRTHP